MWDKVLDVPGFVRISEYGETLIRVVSNPYYYKVHYYPDKKTGKLKRAFCEVKKCKICNDELFPATARRAIQRYSMWVIWGDKRRLSILEVGKRLFFEIAKVIKKYPLSRNYDMGIVRKGQGYQTEYIITKCNNFILKDEFWNELDEKISQYDMRGLVGDLQAKEQMILMLEEEERILNKAW